MKLKDAELLPGIVLDASDSEKLGRIKCEIPGIFDSGTMDAEALPWIMPITHGYANYQSYSEQKAGDKVWVLRNLENEYELWYIPMFELNGSTQDLINAQDNEIVFNRDMGGRNATIYYNSEEGVVMKIGEVKVNITGGGEIILTNGDKNVKVCQDGVKLGCGDPTDVATRAKELIRVIQNAANGLEKAANACNGILSPLQPGLTQAADALKDIPIVKCNNVYVN